MVNLEDNAGSGCGEKIEEKLRRFS